MKKITLFKMLIIIFAAVLVVFFTAVFLKGNDKIIKEARFVINENIY